MQRIPQTTRIPPELPPGLRPWPELEFVHGRSDWIERRAKLFEAGAYPDKGLTVTPDQLASLASGFTDPVPVLIEHAESPLELGYLTQVEAVDDELFGTIALTREANDLLERSGARSLSIALSPDLSEIREVSLVRSPRVPDAQLFGADPVFSTAFVDPRTEREQQSDETEDWKAKFHRLQQATRQAEAKRAVQAFVDAGKLTPAQAPFAEALMQLDQAVVFGEHTQSLTQLLSAMIERQPPMRLFTELAPGSGAPIPPTMLPEEAAFYREHFPDVPLDEIAGASRAKGGT